MDPCLRHTLGPCPEQLRAARKATLLPGSGLDAGHLYPRLPGRDSSGPFSHQASGCGAVGTQSSLGVPLPGILFHQRPSSVRCSSRDSGAPGSQALSPSANPRSRGPGAGSSPWAAGCSSPGLFSQQFLPTLCCWYLGECHEFAVFNQATCREEHQCKRMHSSSPEMLFSLTANFPDNRRTWIFGDIISFLCVYGGKRLGCLGSPARGSLSLEKVPCRGWRATVFPPQLQLLRDPRECGSAPWWH